MKSSIKSRIRVTRTGKLIRRKMGINHTKSNKTGARTRDKRKTLNVHSADMRMFRKYNSQAV